MRIELRPTGHQARRKALIDLRPVGFVLGLLLTALGAAMLAPLAVDLWDGSRNWQAFFEAAVFTSLTGAMISVACRSGLDSDDEFTVREAFLLTTGIWVFAPVFGALPFITGAPHAGFTDAYFEAVSGITTTGSSVFPHLDLLPPGVLLWRGILNWLGGLGIAFVAMIFLPVMRVGGMKFFRTEGFDTMGKVLPRATDIAQRLLAFYVLLTLACIVTYVLFGMTLFDGVVNAFATVATGGFSTSDASFGKYAGPAEYAGAFFMILSALPYIRFVQMMGGAYRPMLRDPQVHAFLRWVTIAVGITVLYRVLTSNAPIETIVRQSLFNIVSIFTGTGFSSADVNSWGPFAVVVALAVGLIGGCSSSSSGAFSVFRTQILFAAIRAQISKVHSPSRMMVVRYDGVVLDAEVMNPLIMYLTGYLVTIMILSIGVSLTGVDIESALMAVWTSIGNIGYVFGSATQPTGTMVDFDDTAKWLMIIAMLMGRLGMVAGYVLLLPRFWRG
ncbi:TrkH family potassium uptake protein [Acidimangrovimonas sediminis]|uniref:TrkH family potassium uptake protein n=1 Tax=Acidimangrovimonas sediminis TaxID=2056283 RepID=UPI001E627D0B|nr:TrkH family potassium uptake protein [Acidimangrovimonas sediminis]